MVRLPAESRPVVLKSRVSGGKDLGGRRAGPPEDCGGVPGYQELLEVLADPRHPEHDSMLEWLGLDSPDELDPAECDLDEINDMLPARVLAKA